MITVTRHWSGGVPGFCDCLPSGQQAFNIPGSHIETNWLGLVGFPGDNSSADYLCISPDGTKLACQGQKDDTAWLYADGKWTSHGPAFGPTAVGFDNFSTLIINRPPTAWGIRYFDAANNLVTCDSTRIDRTRGIYEWTVLADLIIAQGGDEINEGAIARFADQINLRLAFGAVRNIRARQSGEVVSIAFCEYPTRTASCLLTSTTELRSLPAVGAVPIDPNPPIVVIDPTNPTNPPKETPMAIDYLSVITSVRSKYPTPLGARHWEFLVEVAQATGTQLFRKEDSNSVLIPSLGKRVSLDVIGRGSLGDNWADILGDSEGAAVPTFDLHPNAAGEYVDVSTVTLPGGPVVPPVDPNPPTDLTPIYEALAKLTLDIASLTASLAKLSGTLTDDTIALSERISLTNDRIGKLRVVGRTSQAAFHSHNIDLGVS